MFFVHIFQWYLQLQAWCDRWAVCSGWASQSSPQHRGIWLPSKASVHMAQRSPFSSSFFFCLAAGKANLRATCSLTHKLLILLNRCAKNHETLSALSLAFNATLHRHTIQPFSKFYMFFSEYIQLYFISMRERLPEPLINLHRQITKAYAFFPFPYCDLHA